MSRRRIAHGLWLVAMAALPACSGLSYRHATDVPAPHTLAVLPIAGSATPPARELARGLLEARLRELGYRLAEDAWVDQVLTENGWLGDPDTFAPNAGGLPIGQLADRLDVDGVLLADGFDESSWNILVLRRHTFDGALRIVTRDGRDWWSARHAVGGTAGFLLQSGQLLTELRAQGMHGASAATIALVDALVQDVIATLPADADRAEHQATPPPQPMQSALRAIAGADAGEQRMLITASAAPIAALTCDFGPDHTAVPMSREGAVFMAAIDVPAGRLPGTATVRARDAFGAEAQQETQPEVHR